MNIIEGIHQTKSVFLTASPFLIEEIKKQFDDLHSQVKDAHAKKC